MRVLHELKKKSKKHTGEPEGGAGGISDHSSKDLIEASVVQRRTKKRDKSVKNGAPDEGGPEEHAQ